MISMNAKRLYRDGLLGNSRYAEMVREFAVGGLLAGALWWLL
jgi:hypothetical protein